MWLSILVICMSLDGRGATCQEHRRTWDTGGQCARYVLNEYARAKLRGPHSVKEWDCLPPETRG